MAGPVLLFSNNASSALTGAITSTATSLQISAGTGILFPVPTSGQYFVATINDAATGIQKEIIWVTVNSADTFTITRAQEGTVAQNWNAGDTVSHLWTAGQAQSMVQNTQLVQVTATVYSGVDSGAVNSMVITTTQPLTSLAVGVEIDVVPLFTNTSTVLANPNGIGAKAVLRQDGSPLLPGDYIAGNLIKLMYNGTAFNLIAVTPQHQYKLPTRSTSSTAITLGLADIGTHITLNNPTTQQTVTLPDHTSSSIKSGYAIRLTVTGGANAVINANGAALVINNGTNTLVNTITMFSGEEATFIWDGSTWTATGTFMARYIVATLGQSLTTSGYQKFAGGLIIQWVTGPTDPASPAETGFYQINWPLVWPNALLATSISTSINGANNADVNYEVNNAATTTSKISLTRNLQTGSATVLVSTNAIVIGIGY